MTGMCHHIHRFSIEMESHNLFILPGLAWNHKPLSLPSSLDCWCEPQASGSVHLFMCLLSICTSSRRKHLSRYFIFDWLMHY
jgi:hypothetical protein